MEAQIGRWDAIIGEFRRTVKKPKPIITDNLMKQHQWKGEGARAARLMADTDFEREFRPFRIGGQVEVKEEEVWEEG
jgi:hypothetical protein